MHHSAVAEIRRRIRVYISSFYGEKKGKFTHTYKRERKREKEIEREASDKSETAAESEVLVRDLL